LQLDPHGSHHQLHQPSTEHAVPLDHVRVEVKVVEQLIELDDAPFSPLQRQRLHLQ
jgi:hypothetical protein